MRSWRSAEGPPNSSIIITIMKFTLLPLFALHLLASTLLAETPFERECGQLREQREKAVAAAAEPIQKRYQDHWSSCSAGRRRETISIRR